MATLTDTAEQPAVCQLTLPTGLVLEIEDVVEWWNRFDQVVHICVVLRRAAAHARGYKLVAALTAHFDPSPPEV